jgi:hypothetical protein
VRNDPLSLVWRRAVTDASGDELMTVAEIAAVLKLNQ